MDPYKFDFSKRIWFLSLLTLWYYITVFIRIHWITPYIELVWSSPGRAQNIWFCKSAIWLLHICFAHSSFDFRWGDTHHKSFHSLKLQLNFGVYNFVWNWIFQRFFLSKIWNWTFQRFFSVKLVENKICAQNIVELKS